MKNALGQVASAARVARRQLPLPLRVAIGTAKRRLSQNRIWDNPHFRRQWDLLQQTQWWTRSELEALQTEKLRQLVQHAYENVPYYQRLFAGRHLTPDDFRSLEDLQKLPVLTREDVRRNRESLVAQNVDRHRLLPISTGGSSGVPLVIYHDARTSVPREAAFTLRQWAWAGYTAGDRLVKVRGNQISRTGLHGQRCVWDYDTSENTLLLLGHDMSHEHVSEFARVLLRFRPKFIYGYPSALGLLARFMLLQQMPYRATAVFCESETVYPRQRQCIEEQFGCRVYAGYGHSERAVDAVECEHERHYHVSMEYGILEVLDLDGLPLTRPGALGKVVGTGFDTYCMPLLRYATEDLAVVGDGFCSCGRQSTLVQAFRGRAQEFLVARSGDAIPLGPVYASAPDAAPEVWERVSEISFAQHEPGQLLAELVVLPGVDGPKTARLIQESLYAWLDPGEFSIHVGVVPRIERTARGKWRLLNQTLPVPTESVDFEAAAEAWLQAASSRAESGTGEG
ncbi:MAG: phenylacetate--CoA ligase family protein [Anaerolineae bacterium]